uniref:Aspartyl/asparaginy/proline hydroxylase domain-containing protein n=1 Tax=Odontella aurita TaxID=265563 RepID=A0A7S4JUW8_9STRA|mmetsp:Transcript_54800/g.163980  ORF Transcript_54800/g.163980 Transcript_54800/m.163980 type:complete len:938 (+) Transcript_54800:299-3112(+)
MAAAPRSRASVHLPALPIRLAAEAPAKRVFPSCVALGVHASHGAAESSSRGRANSTLEVAVLADDDGVRAFATSDAVSRRALLERLGFSVSSSAGREREEEEEGRRRPRGRAKERWSCCLSGEVVLPLETVHLSSSRASPSDAVPVPPSSSSAASAGATAALVRTSASALEDALEDALAYPPDDEYDDDDDDDDDDDGSAYGGQEDPVTAYVAEDIHLLRCRRPPPPDPDSIDADVLLAGGGGGEGMLASGPTVLGLIENAGLYGGTTATGGLGGLGGESCPAVDVSLHRPRFFVGDLPGGDAEEAAEEEGEGGFSGYCGFVHPSRGDWSPLPPSAAAACAGALREEDDDDDDEEQHGPSPSPPPARLRIVDLTGLQSSRRRRGEANGEGPRKVSFDSTVGACHLLRSVLRCFNDEDDDGGDELLSSSSMSSSHCSSPWSERYSTSSPSPTSSSPSLSTPPVCQTRDAVIALVVLGHLSSNDDHDDDHDDNESSDEYYERLERSELRSLVSFRTGDAAPSYYLHCAARMLLPKKERGAVDVDDDGIGIDESIVSQLVEKAARRAGTEDEDEEDFDHDDEDFFRAIGGGGNPVVGEEAAAEDATAKNVKVKVKATLLVYRRLPPRDQLTVDHPLGKAAEEEEAAEMGGSAVLDERKRWHCRWEAYVPPKKDDDDDDNDSDDDTDDDDLRPAPQSKPREPSADPPLLHRLVSPPYHSHAHLYPDALSALLDPANLTSVIEEARSIPQWTAWPETAHYSSSSDDGSVVSWTVFPLCHTFPASDPSRRKFIRGTCRHAPRTTALLRTGELGELVRTALFSRLAPGTNLGAHTGWADLANHVLRVHIPLIVPGDDVDGGGEERRDPRQYGLCGTWVDGCVETHAVGVPVVFDDSKVHRAFNYAEEDRFVLIVDLARPGDKLPAGTATGGHTEELDEFIKELT